jgi:Cof subfamily protein (haloacid dehalogenase superfamily)
MQKINYPLIVSDFDGTLVNDDGTISQNNKDAIAAYLADGGAFAISTGRMPSGILSRARELGLKGMVSCCQGAIIMDINTENVVLEGRIPHEVTLKIVEKMEAMGLHIHVYDLWDYYCNMDDEALKMYENAVKSKAKLVVDRKLSDFVRERRLASYKVLAMVRPQDSERVINELAQANFEGCGVTKSSEFLVEVVSMQYSKGTAIAFLADYYHTSVDKTVAIGDQRNDLPMIQQAGVGVAVKNADQALKEQANYVCEYTNEESAVADVIKRFGYR